MEEIQQLEPWLLYVLAGLIGAFGNQVVYWGNRLRRRDAVINYRMVPISIAYIGTGGGVGWVVGVEIESLLMVLGSGAFWPETLKALDAARNVGMLAKR